MCLGRHAMLCACLAAGCGENTAIETVSTTIEGCKEQFAASKGYGYSVDRDAVTSTPNAAVDGIAGAQATLVASQSDLERALLECERGIASGSAGAQNGAERSTPLTNCEYPRLMTHDAALCVAAVHGLKEGRGYAATIVYRSEHRRIAWAVNNNLEFADGTEGGEVLTFDATTGKIFDRTHWSAAE